MDRRSVVRHTHASSQVPCLRRAFDVDGEIASAKLAVTAFGMHEVTLNGEVVGDEVLAPGWTDYRKRVSYSLHDMTGDATHCTPQAALTKC
jgi:alpha-L-rhamnosidase